ncbi:hypothetical protein SISSUDRAFT_1053073 [Sistotremastrum suecicum HHB10207 ss-3]|uniref:Uncharacterized protein n=1 Tax=Sistotremastrum suecicum HHB10207 ss-3 TaxID=1314776 RepID=A0A165ZFJ3_9AGAM|nr:hypothetical protein SISSUDRAFT_1053073 [Sistotremastrum suecicum HHB10207 ss-3]
MKWMKKAIRLFLLLLLLQQRRRGREYEHATRKIVRVHEIEYHDDLGLGRELELCMSMLSDGMGMTSSLSFFSFKST